MASRSDQLAQRRRDLQQQCALQRQQVAYFSTDIESRLVTADRVIEVVARVARNPVALTATIATALILGPWRIMKWISRGALIFSVAQKVRGLIKQSN